MKRIKLFYLMFLLFAFINYAQTGISVISISKSNITINQGSSATIGYFVSLSSGKPWTTYIKALNTTKLNENGINIFINPISGIPPFNGTILIETNNSTTTGNYKIELEANGNDPSSNIATINVTISKSKTTINSSKYLYLLKETNKFINGTEGGSLNISFDNINIELIIPNNTYVRNVSSSYENGFLIFNNRTLKQYNLSIEILKSNTNISNNALFFIGIAINGNITKNYFFENSNNNIVNIPLIINKKGIALYKWIGNLYKNGLYTGNIGNEMNIYLTKNNSSIETYINGSMLLLLTQEGLIKSSVPTTTVVISQNNQSISINNINSREYLLYIIVGIVFIIIIIAYKIFKK